MKIVIAIDSFKGSMTSPEAGNAAAAGVLRVFPDAHLCVCPIADGGEGTTDALVTGLHGEKKTVTVSDPLGRRIQAAYGRIGQTAVIEMASAAGLALLGEEERDPMQTTTYGVGEMISDAIDCGCRNFIIGIGGSATNDGGVGMLQALGFRFADKNGTPVPFGAAGVSRIASIETDSARPELQACQFHIACDVTNPLCGEKGCSAVFSPQKGASAEQIPLMDEAMKRYAELTKTVCPQADATYPGVGAAGGMGFAFHAYLQGKLQSGIHMILEQICIEQELRDADLVITGEGRLDGQTVMGKAPVGVAALAKKYGKPVIAFSGCVTPDAAECNRHGIDAFFPILRTPCTLAEAMDRTNAMRNMVSCVEQAIRLWAVKH